MATRFLPLAAWLLAGGVPVQAGLWDSIQSSISGIFVHGDAGNKTTEDGATTQGLLNTSNASHAHQAKKANKAKNTSVKLRKVGKGSHAEKGNMSQVMGAMASSVDERKARGPADQKGHAAGALGDKALKVSQTEELAAESSSSAARAKANQKLRGATPVLKGSEDMRGAEAIKSDETQKADPKKGDAQKGDVRRAHAEKGDAKKGHVKKGNAKKGDAKEGDAEKSHGHGAKSEAENGHAMKGKATKGKGERGKAKKVKAEKDKAKKDEEEEADRKNANSEVETSSKAIASLEEKFDVDTLHVQRSLPVSPVASGAYFTMAASLCGLLAISVRRHPNYEQTEYMGIDQPLEPLE